MPKYAIGPFETGLQKNVKPWLDNKDAFVELEDAYVFRGRVKKKEGYSFLGRLHLTPTLPEAKANAGVGTTTYNAIITNPPISPDTVTITIAIAAWGNFVFTDNGNGTLTATTVPAGENYGWGTINYETGAFVLNWDTALPAGVHTVNITAYRYLPVVANKKLPCMGFTHLETTVVNFEDLIAFDTDYSFYFTGGQFENCSFYKMNLAAANPVLWTGANSDFFWSKNYYEVLWSTNNVVGNHGRACTAITQAASAVITVGAGHPFIVQDVVFINEVVGMTEINGLIGTVTAIAANTITVNINSAAFGAYASGGVVFALTRTLSGDGIRFYDGFGLNLGWRNFAPPLTFTGASTDTYLKAALILVPYRDHLVALNTTEGTFTGANTVYRNRARWSQNGTPFYATASTPAAATSRRAGSEWADNIPGGGGYNDAPTSEQIVSCAFFKDTLVVYFERSVWELRYTGNEVLPFVWYKINSDLGCESTFSPITFDEGVYAIGDKRITVSNSQEVQPIDIKIPDEVYEIQNDTQGPKRVHGIRDFYRKLVYWTIPTQTAGGTFPEKLLILNYEEKCWSYFNDSFTCFGNYQKSTDYTWATLPYDSWDEWNIPWGSPQSQAAFPDIVGGNQIGNVAILGKESNNDPLLDLMTAAGVPAITNANPAVCYLPNHNLQNSTNSDFGFYDGDYVKFFYVRGFATAVANETVDTAAIGATQFVGSFGTDLMNTGTWVGTIPSTITITCGANTYTDLGNGTLYGGTGNSTIDYENRTFVINFAALGAATPVTISYSYNPLNYRVFGIRTITTDTFSLYTISDAGVFNPLDLSGFGASYTGSGNIQIVNNFYIKTKALSPFLEQDQSFRLSYLDVYTDVNDGTITTELYVGEEPDPSTLLNLSLAKTTGESFNTVSSPRVWKRLFPSIASNFVQVGFTFSPVQMKERTNYESGFELHTMLFDIAPSGRII